MKVARVVLGIFFCVLAAIFLVSGLVKIFLAPNLALTDASGLGVSQAVGTMLPFLITLILGVWLLGGGKKKTNEPLEEKRENR